MDSDRGEWRSRTGFVLAAAGSAVGLGNIWKFPYLTGQNGGAAFLIVYLVLVSTIGVGVMLAGGLAGGGDIDSLASAFRTFTADPLEPLVYLSGAVHGADRRGGRRRRPARHRTLVHPFVSGPHSDHAAAGSRPP